MKTIVIAGSHSNTGKTTLGLAIKKIFPEAVLVKIGTGAEKQDSGIPLYQPSTPYATIADEHDKADYLIIESNSIINEITPDLLIFLPGEKKDKPSAAKARQNADLIHGVRVPCAAAKQLSQRLGIAPKVFCRILDAANIKLCACEFGVF